MDFGLSDMTDSRRKQELLVGGAKYKQMPVLLFRFLKLVVLIKKKKLNHAFLLECAIIHDDCMHEE